MEHGNRSFYERRATVRILDQTGGLFAPEKRILERIASDIAGRPVLDIGVGGGRTTPRLHCLSGGVYIGVDYSETMVRTCRHRFPDIPFEVVDARDLSRFSDGQFEFVMFSFNGLDDIDHVGRMRALSEIRRVLAEDGWFAFSSHNRNAPPIRATDLANIKWTLNPLRLAKRLARYGRGIWRYSRSRSLEVSERDFAYCFDGNFNTLTYYIDPAAQVAQLDVAGFALDMIVTLDGRAVTADTNDLSPFLHYLARKKDLKPAAHAVSG